MGPILGIVSVICVLGVMVVLVIGLPTRGTAVQQKECPPYTQPHQKSKN